MFSRAGFEKTVDSQRTSVSTWEEANACSPDRRTLIGLSGWTSLEFGGGGWGSAMSTQDFFPDGVFGDQQDDPLSYTRWYERFLRSMGEGPLYPPAADAANAYRFLFLPTFHKPLLVRLTAKERCWCLVSKTNDGAGGYFPGPSTTESERNLAPAECVKLEQGVNRVRFWSLPVSDGSIGCDGSQWVLEGVSPGRYHVVHRWSPHGGQFARFCELLLDLAGLARGCY